MKVRLVTLCGCSKVITVDDAEYSNLDKAIVQPLIYALPRGMSSTFMPAALASFAPRRREFRYDSDDRSDAAEGADRVYRESGGS